MHVVHVQLRYWISVYRLDFEEHMIPPELGFYWATWHSGPKTVAEIYMKAEQLMVRTCNGADMPLWVANLPYPDRDSKTSSVVLLEKINEHT